MTEQEQSQLRSIVQSPQWRTVTAFAEDLCAKVKTEQTSYETEWDSIRDSLLAEGQSRGIKRLLQSIEREAFSDNNEKRNEPA